MPGPHRWEAGVIKLGGSALDALDSRPSARQGPARSPPLSYLSAIAVAPSPSLIASASPPPHSPPSPLAIYRSLLPIKGPDAAGLSPGQLHQLATLLQVAAAIGTLTTGLSPIVAPLTPTPIAAPSHFDGLAIGHAFEPRSGFITLPHTLGPLLLQAAALGLQGPTSAAPVTHLAGLIGPNGSSVSCLVDSGASALFMSTATAQRCGLTPLPSGRTIKLADGSIRPTAGTVTARCTLKALGEVNLSFEAEFCVTELLGHEVILGTPWLQCFNPDIDWVAGRFTIARPSHAKEPFTLLRHDPQQKWQRELEPATAASAMARLCSPAAVATPISTTRSEWNRLLRKGQLDLGSMELIRVKNMKHTPSARPTDTNSALVQLATAATTAPSAANAGLAKLLEEFKDCLPDKLGPVDPAAPSPGGIQHKIELAPDAKPHAAPLRRYSPLEDAEIRRVVEAELESGRMRESTSPWGAMVLLARKKDGTLRFCVDYRMLNNVTLKNRYALPLADDCFDRARGACIFSKLDLHSGFWQIQLDPGSAAMTAFRTRFGHYEYTVLPMGLCNAPGTFMHVMNSVFRKQLDRFMLVFLDDIFIYSSSEAEHLVHLREVLTVLRANHLYLKPSKCEWMKTEVEFLGHRIGREGLSVDPHKVDAVRDWPAPKDVSQMRSFLGLAGYYRRFIENYSKIALPLTELTKDEVAWCWGPAEVAAFEQLKQTLSHAPVLQLADPALPYVIHCDASGFAVGACLMQDHGEGLQPVSYISAKMKPAETRYAPHEQELLALVYACRSWRHYLHNGKPFTVLSDHQSLRFFTTQPLLSARQARWKDSLAEFDFSIRYIEGPKNTVADALSRRADHKSCAGDEFDQRLLGAEEVSKDQFLASLEFVHSRMEPATGALCAGRLPALTLSAASLRGRRIPKVAARRLVIPAAPPAWSAERVGNKQAAEAVGPAAPDRPEPNAKGVITMPSQRCTGDTRAGRQCGARTRRGQLCFHHRKQQHGTRIKAASHGLGLFATRAHKKGDDVALYAGDLVRGRDPTVGGPYFLELRMLGGGAIDAARTNAGDGRWVNDPKGTKLSNGRPATANCDFVMPAGSVAAKLRATRDIAPGDEILANYGSDYWRALRKFGTRLVSQPRPVPRPPRPARGSPAALTALEAAAELNAATMVYGDFELIAQAREAALLDPLYAALLASPGSDQTVRDGLLWEGRLLVVPDDPELRTRLMSELHDTPTGGHFGRDKTQAALRARFVWKGMAAQAAQFVAGCDMCQRVKHSQQRTPGLLMPLPVPEELDAHWTMDFVTAMPRTARGHDAIQGHFSRGGSIKRLAATDSKVDAVRAADCFIDSVVRHHGVPASIITDRGPQFTSRMWTALWERLGTKLMMSTAYHAQTDGHSEREQRTMSTWLKAFGTENPDDWDLLLPLAELALNCMPQAASGLAPYELLYGRNPALSVDRALSNEPPSEDAARQLADIPAAEARWTRMAAAWTKVRGKLLEAQQRMATNADKHRRELSFKVGDLVLLSTQHLRISDPKFNAKLSHLYCGPFPVLRVINANAYEIELPEHMHIHPVINISHLREYRDGRVDFPSRGRPAGLDRPPPAALDPSGALKYTVERVLAQQTRGREVHYLVLWEGYPYAEATWEPASGLGPLDAIDEFLRLVRATGPAGSRRRGRGPARR